MKDERRRTAGWMIMHECVWRMNEEELKDGWVYMNMNGGWIKKNWRMDEYAWIRMEHKWRRTKGWMRMHKYVWRMNEEELKDGWVCMNMYGGWMKINQIKSFIRPQVYNIHTNKNDYTNYIYIFCGRGATR